MSKIENKRITIPINITVQIYKNPNFSILRIKNEIISKGVQFKQIFIPPNFNIEIINNKIYIKRDINFFNTELGGTVRSLIANIINGLNNNFIMSYTLKGVGNKFVLNEDNTVSLFVGYSQPIILTIPNDIQLQTKGVNHLIGRSTSKLLLTQFFSRIAKFNKNITSINKKKEIKA